MIFVDSGAWYAIFIQTDPDHEAAFGWYSINDSPLFTTDYVIDETLTLFRARGQISKALEVGAMFFAGELAEIHFLTPAEIEDSWEVFRRFGDKRWSFTDCTSKAVMESLGIATAFSFDRHFHQFGTITVVPPETAD